MAKPPPPAAAAPDASSVGTSTQTVFMSVVAAMLLYVYGSKWLKQLQEHIRFTRMKKDVQKRFGPGGVPLSTEDDDDGDEGDAEAGNGLEMQWGGRKTGMIPAGRKSTAPALCMQLTNGRSREVALKLDEVKSMKQLQACVLHEWCAAGGDRSESLMMELVDASGNAAKVSKTTDMNAVRRASSLNLFPKHLRSKRGCGSGVMRDDGLANVVEDEDGPSRLHARAAAGLD